MPKSKSTQLTTVKPTNGLIDLGFDFFASNDSIVIHLSSKYWVKFKRHLNQGEQDELDNAALRGMQQDGVLGTVAAGSTYIFDLKRQRELKLALYLADWNIPDKEGKTVRLPAQLAQRIQLLRNLDPRFGKLLHEQIDKLIAEDAELALAQAVPVDEQPEEEDDDEEAASPLAVSGVVSEAISP